MGIHLSPTILIENPTLAALSNYFLQQHPEAISKVINQPIIKKHAAKAVEKAKIPVLTRTITSIRLKMMRITTEGGYSEALMYSN